MVAVTAELVSVLAAELAGSAWTLTETVTWPQCAGWIWTVTVFDALPVGPSAEAWLAIWRITLIRSAWLESCTGPAPSTFG